MNNEPNLNSVSSQRRALEELDRQCQTLNAKGVDLLVDGASHVPRMSSFSPNFFLVGCPKGFSAAPSAGSNMKPIDIASVQRFQLVHAWHTRPDVIRVSRNSSGLLFSIGLPGILGIQVRLGEEIRHLHFLVFLRATSTNDAGTSPTSDVSLTINDEITFLSKAADLIIARVCQATAFENLQACVETVAEVVLRFLKFRSSNLPLEDVRIRAIVENEAGKKFDSERSIAYWLPSNDPVGYGVEAERSVGVITGKELGLKVAAANSGQNRSGLNGVDGSTDDIGSHELNAVESDVAIATPATNDEHDNTDAELNSTSEDRKFESDQATQHKILADSSGGSKGLRIKDAERSAGTEPIGSVKAVRATGELYQDLGTNLLP